MSRKTDQEREMEQLLNMAAIYIGRPDLTSFIGAGDIGKPVKKPTLVYRVEMPNGKGPYNSGLGKGEEIYSTICAGKPGRDCAHNAILNNEHMGITEQSFYNAHGDAAYGCDSIAAIKDWFGPQSRQYLRDVWNASLKVYQIKEGDYLLSLPHGEVVFSRKDATLVRALDLISLTHEVEIA